MSRYGMVIDLMRCTGCQTCVVACQMNNNQRQGVSWSKVDTIEFGTWPDGDRFALPHGCMHCENAPCVHVCPNGASVQRADGIVTVDYDKCLGCGACLMVCPHDARTINFSGTWNFGAEGGAPYELYGTPHMDVAEKCVFCADRVDAGEEPCCVRECPQAARIFGDLDDPESDVSRCAAENNAEALPGTALHYVKGIHEFDLGNALLTNESDVPSIMLSNTGADVPTQSADSVAPVVAGVAGVAVAAVAAGAGYAVGARKKSAQNMEGE